jgi:DNA polymerase-3 subunit alpha
MESIPMYVRNKNNNGEVKYIHPKLKPILEVTYGCLVYQEQVMQVVRDLGGYTYGRSDLVRRAMGKKKMDVMEQERKYFIHGKLDDNGNIEIPGCIRNGIQEDAANKIYDDMIDFAKYAFNKSHAAAYGVLAYQTGYLKAHYPVEFMAALITSIMGNNDKVVEYIRECNILGIQVLKPDINKSYSTFSVEDKNIRFGLSAIKNVGVNVINHIAEERKINGEFKDFIDFCKRIESKDLNKRVIESLIKCGAFDSISPNRAQLIAGYESLIESIINDRKKNIQGQVSLFDTMDISISNESTIYNLPKVCEFNEKEKLSLEKEVLGLYVSGHPLSQFEYELNLNTTISNNILNELKDDNEEYLKLDEKEIIIGGMIVNKTIKTTRKNDIMAFIELEDLYGSIEIMVFPQILQKYNNILREDNIVYVKGKLSIKEEENAKIIARQFSEIKKINNKSLYIRIDSMSNKDVLNKIKDLMSSNIGDSTVYIFAQDIKKAFKYEEYAVDINDDLIYKLNNLIGEENIKVKM